LEKPFAHPLFFSELMQIEQINTFGESLK